MILPNSLDLNTLETEIYRYCCAVGREIFQTVLTQLDNKLMLERDREVYRHKGKRGTTLKTIMGEVPYERVLYEYTDENGDVGRVYLLDQELRFETVGFISSLLAGKIADASCEMSYRKTAQTISELTGQSISHTGAWDVVQALGVKLDKEERQAAVRAKNNEGIGTLETKLLFEEQDGVYLTLQGKDREKHGKSAEMKIAIAYTGAKKTGKKRYNLTDKVACANFEGKLIFKLLYSKKIDLLLEVIEAYSNSTDDEKERDNFLTLLKYFQNNKDGLISYKRLGIDLPEPPEGVVYRGCGAMESNVFSIIGHRMKNNRTAWSIRGGNNLAKLLTLKTTGKLSETLSKLASTILPERFSDEVQTVLSASKVPNKEGKGYNGFTQTSIPPSLKWMKDIFALKPIS